MLESHSPGSCLIQSAFKRFGTLTHLPAPPSEGAALIGSLQQRNRLVSGCKFFKVATPSDGGVGEGRTGGVR